MLIIDAHQDLAWNMLTFGRDYTLPVAQIRDHERGAQAPLVNGETLLGWSEYQKGRIAVVFATLFVSPRRRKLGDWDVLHYADTRQARTQYRLQLDRYHCLVDEHPDHFSLIMTRPDLDDVLIAWNSESEQEHAVGLVILMEGAEAVGDPAELELWWESGVRLIGPAWAGTRFCGGTREPGPLTPEGYALLDGMADYGFTLDISHMDETAVLQALDHYPGRIVATHSNAMALLKGIDNNRHLSDRVIQGLIDRKGIIGIVPVNPFLKPGWNSRDEVTLNDAVAHIDHICQIAGNAMHVGLGTDFDGGFGLQSAPGDVDSIADLQKIPTLLTQSGYSQEDIQRIMGSNWENMLRDTLPEV